MAGRIEVAGARYTVHGMHKGEMASNVEDAVKVHRDFGIKADTRFHKFLMKQNSGTLYGIMTALYAGNLHPVLKSYKDGVQLSLQLQSHCAPRRS